jgi:hypothetical protein
MAKERKIALVAKKLSFKEAEEADDIYWAEKSAEYRLRALMDLREMDFGNIKDKSIKKIVYKRSLQKEVDIADISKLKSRNKKK